MTPVPPRPAPPRRLGLAWAGPLAAVLLAVVTVVAVVVTVVIASPAGAHVRFSTGYSDVRRPPTAVFATS